MKTNQGMVRLKRGPVVAGGLVLLLLALASLLWTSRASAAITLPPAEPHPAETQWTPVGVTWTLTVKFLSGARAGQSETSLMTFLPHGRLTATFPHSSMLPAIDGRWYMTVPNAFHYRFRESLLQNGAVFAFVQVQVDACLTSQKTYEAGGVGAVYAAATGQPIAGQYNVSQTFATAS